MNDVARLKDEKSQADGFRFDVLFRRRTGVCAFGALVSNDKKYWLFAVSIWGVKKLPSQLTNQDSMERRVFFASGHRRGVPIPKS